MINIYVIGPAGSGKSSLVRAFGDWIDSIGLKVVRINLDPGAESLGYDADFDVCDLVTVNELMKREGLGPNGALIRAAEIIERDLGGFAGRINSAVSDYRIFDTPGQMEIFLFRNFGPSLVSKISGRSASVFTIDPSLVYTRLDLPVIKLFSLVIELRLGIPTIEVLTKSDLYPSLFGSMTAWSKELPQIEGISGELASGLSSVVEMLEKKKRLIPVSAKTCEGIEALHKAVGELFCSCGDLT
ncbi:MAG: ATP/GTP-binding protein [Candidatus Verstraetearchaeota archaeon]|nr:ATP/GTP-binding protein [Candidatus Verstraetearchaeota archaeon]